MYQLALLQQKLLNEQKLLSINKNPYILLNADNRPLTLLT